MLASTTLPDNAGYVAAAYLVFLALLLVYVGIMAYKLVKVQRHVVEINALVDEDPPAAAAEPSSPLREETPA